MIRWRRVKSLTRRHYRLLAALLLADGGWVSRSAVAETLYDRPVAATWISRRVIDLGRLSGVRIEARFRRGYRLLAVPPDEHLDAMLACVPEVKQSCWWRQQRRACEEVS